MGRGRTPSAMGEACADWSEGRAHGSAPRRARRLPARLHRSGAEYTSRRLLFASPLCGRGGAPEDAARPRSEEITVALDHDPAHDREAVTAWRSSKTAPAARKIVHENLAAPVQAV